MSASSVPAMVMAGITFYAGLYYLLIYFRRRENRINLTFALTCLAVSLYDVSSAGLYNAAGVAEGASWQRMQFIAAALITVAFLRFAMDYLGQGSKQVWYALAALCAVAVIVQLVDRSGLTWAVDQPSIKDILFPFGHIIYYEATPGPLSILQDLMELAAILYVLWLGVRSYWRERNQAAFPLVVTLGIFFVSVVNDVAVGIGLYKFVYTIEYAYMSVILLMSYMLSNALEQALSTAQRRELELAEATRQAQQAAQAEQQAREREAQVARQLRQAVDEYSAFLERVAAGDYSARLVLGEKEGAQELAALGHRLNVTVESLVTALQDLQAVQRRYARQAWESFTRSRGVRLGFRAHDEVVEPIGEAWLKPMSSAVREKEAVADERELALPIISRGQVIGAIGARREPGDWKDDEVALVTAITDQLAQTLEGLRLLDETQRLAAREQIINTVTARIRGVPTVNAILQRTVEELGRNFGASRASIRVEMSEPAGKAQAEDSRASRVGDLI